MENSMLRERLEELRLELLALPETNQLEQDKRDALAAQIRDTLANEDLGDFNVSLRDTLESEVIAFEESHPKLAQLMSGIKDMLAAMGI